MRTNYKYHFLFWGCYILWDIMQEITANALSMVEAKFSYVVKLASMAALLGAPVKILLFYCLYFFILRPNLQKRFKLITNVFLFFIFSIPALLAQRAITYYIVVRIVYGVDNSAREFLNVSVLVFTYSDMMLPVLLLIIFELYRYLKHSRETERALAQEKMVSEIKFLKSQINPHFLFNTLGTIHALCRNKAPEAANLTVNLSQLIRFMLYETERPFISIKEEVRLLDDYIALEQVRFENKLNFSFKKEIDDEEQQITPLILLPFVENAFKHGVAESRFNSFITIQIKLNKGKLFFETTNSFEQEADPCNENNLGIGLKNVKRQLELLYPEHELITRKIQHTYIIKLSIDLLSHAEVDLPGYRR